MEFGRGAIWRRPFREGAGFVDYRSGMKTRLEAGEWAGREGSRGASGVPILLVD